jgi:putative methionine-R-sulfoxide reductase with GAF domain
MAETLTGAHIHFLPLQKAVFCVECEILSENNTPHCFACGSRAVVSLSRVLGGSLLQDPGARLISDAELDRLVRQLLRTVPETAEAGAPVSFSSLSPRRHHAREAGSQGHLVPSLNLRSLDENLGPAIHVIAERAQALTRASGAAIALKKGNEIVCRARTGRTAPDLGVRLQTDSGLSAQCVRTGEVVLCHDAEEDPHADHDTCRHLGVRSVLAAPLRHFRMTLGVFTVLSGAPHAFDHRDVATMQLLSSMMVAAIARLSYLKPDRRTA